MVDIDEDVSGYEMILCIEENVCGVTLSLISQGKLKHMHDHGENDLFLLFQRS